MAIGKGRALLSMLMEHQMPAKEDKMWEVEEGSRETWKAGGERMKLGREGKEQGRGMVGEGELDGNGMCCILSL